MNVYSSSGEDGESNGAPHRLFATIKCVADRAERVVAAERKPRRSARGRAYNTRRSS
jgi:hypothetical protein